MSSRIDYDGTADIPTPQREQCHQPPLHTGPRSPVPAMKPPEITQTARRISRAPGHLKDYVK